MSTALTPDQMQSLARLGAERRIQELEAEIAAIRRAFPQASGAAAPARRRGRPPKSASKSASKNAATSAAKSGGGAAARRRRRSRMSPEARREVSERMKRYWAEYRKKKQAQEKK